MFNVNFKSTAEAAKVNNLTDAQLADHLVKYFKNLNYREKYNKTKVAVEKELRNDPVIAKRREELNKKFAK